MAREVSVDPVLFSHLSDPEQERHPDADRVVDAVEELAPLERAVVECIVWGRMSKVETAEALGVSRSYVHKVWRRAKEKLGCALS